MPSPVGVICCLDGLNCDACSRCIWMQICRGYSISPWPQQAQLTFLFFFKQQLLTIKLCIGFVGYMGCGSFHAALHHCQRSGEVSTTVTLLFGFVNLSNQFCSWALYSEDRCTEESVSLSMNGWWMMVLQWTWTVKCCLSGIVNIF